VIPLTALADDGLVDYGVIVGTFAAPTDRAPNSSDPATSEPAVLPEPGSLALIAVGGLSLAIRRLRRRIAPRDAAHQRTSNSTHVERASR
jgi:hypothetical protein